METKKSTVKAEKSESITVGEAISVDVLINETPEETEKRMKQEEEDRERYIKSDSFLNYLVQMGCDKDVADRHREELYYIDWLMYHHCFIDFDSEIDFKEQIAQYFLKFDYSPEAIAEYFSNDLKNTTKDEWYKIIGKVQNEHKND